MHLTAEGKLDWERIYTEVSPVKINDLRIAGLCPFNRMEETQLSVDTTPSSSTTFPDKPWTTPNETGWFWADRVKLLASEAPDQFQWKLNTLSQMFEQFYDGRNPKADVLADMAQQIETADPFIAAELRLAAEDYNHFFGHLPDWQRRSGGG